MLPLSQTTGYAVRALRCLQEPGGQPVLVEAIAESTGIPRSYLSKLIHKLAKKGLVVARRCPAWLLIPLYVAHGAVFSDAVIGWNSVSIVCYLLGLLISQSLLLVLAFTAVRRWRSLASESSLSLAAGLLQPRRVPRRPLGGRSGATPRSAPQTHPLPPARCACGWHPGASAQAPLLLLPVPRPAA